MKKWMKRTALAVLTYLVLQTAWLVVEREWRRSKGEREFAAAVAETERTDPDWTWEAISAKRHAPPPETNGAALIPRIKSQFPPEWIRSDDPTKWEPPPLPSPPNQAFAPSTITATRRELERAHAAVELARTFKDYPTGNRAIELAPEVWQTRLQDTQDTRAVAILLRADTVLAVDAGKTDLAADDLLGLLYISRSIGDEPFLISQLVRIAARTIAARSLEWVLGQIELGEPPLAVLQSAWTADTEEPLLLYGLRGERAVNDVMMRNMVEGTITTAALEGKPGESGLTFWSYATWLFRAKLWKDRVYLHRYFTRAVEIAERPHHEQPAAIKELPDLPGDDSRVARLFVPAVEKIAVACWRSTAESRCVVVALACERFRLARGRWPGNLAEIPTELLAAVPLDPHDGQPLRYRRLADGIVVYSVGKDGKDDGGNISHVPGQFAPDEGIRLWDRAQRRVAPVEPAPAHKPPGKS